ncbi:MAG: hypothetical protein EOR73_18795 [Mesorhizobium sp.]|nr:MAG: hypothetical protein EOR73_18795 [Mesorhizobium sp.]
MSQDEGTATARWTVKAELCAVGRDKPLLVALATILCLYCGLIAGPILYAFLAIQGMADSSSDGIDHLKIARSLLPPDPKLLSRE